MYVKTLSVKKIQIVVYILFTLALSIFISSAASAASVTGFRAGNIMSDQVFTDYRSMSKSSIQNFLDVKGSSCSGSLCLKNYTQGGKKASEIIYNASQKYKINPKVFIVLLQKEVGLVTDTSPQSWQYRTATGYGCPDTAACDSQYYGFTNQIKWSGTMFRAIMDSSPTWYAPYTLGTNRVYWHPSAGNYENKSGDRQSGRDGCGYKTISIENRTTVALYSYTPYQPNSAALSAGYGTGNSCSAYGNRNFYQYFKDWFGSPQGVGVLTSIIDSTTNKSGEQASVGFKLLSAPTSNVTLSFRVSSPSNAKVVGTGKVTITKNSWNSASKNVIEVVGLNNASLTGTFQYSLVPDGKPVSSDKRYASLQSDYTQNIPLLQLDDGGTTPVYRLYSSDLGQHFYTASTLKVNQLTSDGWRNEGVKFNYCKAGEQSIARLVKGNERRLDINDSIPYNTAVASGYTLESLDFATSRHGNTPVYWRYDASNNRNLYTTSSTEGLSSGFTDMGVAFNSCSADQEPVFRLYRPSNKSHFYTTSPSERDHALYQIGYRYEQLGYYTCKNGTTPLYRLYRPSNNAHFYTTSTSERDQIVRTIGYRNEGEQFKVCGSSGTPVYRLYRPSNNAHFYTTSQSEVQSLSRQGFRDEGSKFFAN
jgi:hypothetical protein